MFSFSGVAGILLAVFALLALRSRHVRMVFEDGLHLVPAGGRTYAGSFVALAFAAVSCYLLVHKHTEEELELDARTAYLDKREELLEHPPVRMGRVARIDLTDRLSHGDPETFSLELFGDEAVLAPYQVRLPLPGFRGIRVGDFVLVYTGETGQVLGIQKITACAPTLGLVRARPL